MFACNRPISGRSPLQARAGIWHTGSGALHARLRAHGEPSQTHLRLRLLTHMSSSYALLRTAAHMCVHVRCGSCHCSHCAAIGAGADACTYICFVHRLRQRLPPSLAPGHQCPAGPPHPPAATCRPACRNAQPAPATCAPYFLRPRGLPACPARRSVWQPIHEKRRHRCGPRVLARHRSGGHRHCKAGVSHQCHESACCC